MTLLATILDDVQKYSIISPQEIAWLLEHKNEELITKSWANNNIPSEDFSYLLPERQAIVFQNYHALYPIGAGAYGIVFKAYKMGTGTFFALKKHLSNSNLEYAQSLERFHRGVMLVQKLNHLHILPIISAGQQNGENFYVTPFIADGSLARKISQYPIQTRTIEHVFEICSIMLQIARAIEYAHQHNVIHRDIKPENILIQGNQAYLADFGLAREIVIQSHGIITHGVIGTPLYVAPEIWRLQPCIQSDIYSMCVILYEIFSGVSPFYGRTPEEIYMKQLAKRYPNPPPIPFHVPNGIHQFIIRGLCNDPRGRYPTASDFIEKFENILKQF